MDPWTRAKFLEYFRRCREKQNGSPRELTSYDLLDAPNNLYALPKTASNTCTKFHYDPISISGAIAKNRCATSGATPSNWSILIKLGVCGRTGALGLCTKFHYDPMSISEVIAEKQNGTSRELTPYDFLNAPHSLHALSKTASNTCTKFYHNPISISQVIAKNRIGTSGS